MSTTRIRVSPGDGHKVTATTGPDGAVYLDIESTDPAPDPAPPAHAARRLVGVHDDRLPTTRAATFPGSLLERPFISGVQTVTSGLVARVERLLRPYWNAGLRPQYSVKLDHNQVMAGQWDRSVRELAEWHNSQPAAELVIWHEPENDPIMRGGAFPRYFNRVAGVFREVCTSVPLVYASMGYQWLLTADGTRSIKGWTDRPADWQGVQADVFAIDLYSGSSVPLTTIIPEHRGWQRWMQSIVGERDWGVSERGFITGTAHETRAATIDRETAWLLGSPEGRRCRRYIYWNTAGTENNPAIPADGTYGEPAVRRLVSALANDLT